MRNYYVDQLSGPHLTLLVGPFKDEQTARTYEIKAAKIAMADSLLAEFDSFGVVAINDLQVVGLLNDRMNIDPAQLAE